MQKILVPKKIGIFGGKFDPPHLGHQLIIFLAFSKYHMDEVWIIPSYSHAFGYESSNFDVRLKMCEYLTAPWSSDKVKILDDEKSIEKSPVFTIDLMYYLHNNYGAHNYTIFIGEDNWEKRDKWKEFEKLSTLASISVIGRGTKFDTYFPLPDISSSILRDMIKDNKNVDFLMPDGIYNFIKKNNLFS